MFNEIKDIVIMSSVVSLTELTKGQIDASDLTQLKIALEAALEEIPASVFELIQTNLEAAQEAQYEEEDEARGAAYTTLMSLMCWSDEMRDIISEAIYDAAEPTYFYSDSDVADTALYLAFQAYQSRNIGRRHDGAVMVLADYRGAGLEFTEFDGADYAAENLDRILEEGLTIEQIKEEMEEILELSTQEGTKHAQEAADWITANHYATLDAAHVIALQNEKSRQTITV